MTHTPGEIPVRRADAFQRHVHAAEGIHRPAQARGATGILGHLHARIDQDVPDALFAPARGLQIMHDLWRGWHAKRIDGHAVPIQHPGEFHEIARLPARARTDIRAVQFDV
jgi:hypothetical protein